MSNEDRGEQAANLLHHYANEHNEGELDDETIIDFIVNALHYAENWYGGGGNALAAVTLRYTEELLADTYRGAGIISDPYTAERSGNNV